MSFCINFRHCLKIIFEFFIAYINFAVSQYTCLCEVYEHYQLSLSSENIYFRVSVFSANRISSGALVNLLSESVVSVSIVTFCCSVRFVHLCNGPCIICNWTSLCDRTSPRIFYISFIFSMLGDVQPPVMKRTLIVRWTIIQRCNSRRDAV